MPRVALLALVLAVAMAATAIAATTRKVTAVESGGLSFSRSSLSADRGKVTLRMRNPSSNSITHAIAIRRKSFNKSGNYVSPGGTSTVRARLKKGRYTFYCPVGDHEEEGMKGTLTIR